MHGLGDDVTRFPLTAGGLFAYDAAESDMGGATASLFVNTVADNESRYTNRDVQKARLARDIQIKIGRPSIKDYMRIVRDKLLPNCPVTTEDIQAAEHIYGPDLGSLKGKTVRRSPDTVQIQTVKLPLQIMER